MDREERLELVFAVIQPFPLTRAPTSVHAHSPSHTHPRTHPRALTLFNPLPSGCVQYFPQTVFGKEFKKRQEWAPRYKEIVPDTGAGERAPWRGLALADVGEPVERLDESRPQEIAGDRPPEIAGDRPQEEGALPH